MTIKKYIVGGFVRDKLLGIPSKDIDLVYVCPDYATMRRVLLDEGVEIYVEKPEYFTIRCHHPKIGPCDVALARIDGEYFDGRHPNSVQVADSIESELSRRDFRMNAIAQDLNTGELIDPFNGQGDIKSKIIRTVGKAEDRFREDFLRLIRALRFSVTKGFRITYEIHEILLTDWAIDGLINVSVERIYEELRKMFEHDSRLSFDVLNRYDKLRNKIFDMGVKLEPTLKE